MYLITNRKLCSKEKYLDIIVEASKNNVEYLILREKDLEYEDLKNIYEDVLYSLRKNSTDIKIIINSCLKLYENYPVYGIHLPYSKFKDLIKKNYKFLKNKAIGLSLHSVEDVIELEHILNSQNIKVEYITLSHIYKTDCKTGLEPKGVELLKEARKFTDIKIVALGGILPENISTVREFCDDFAVMSTIFKSKDVKLVIEQYMM